MCSTACRVHRGGVYSRWNTDCFVYVLKLAVYIVMKYISGGTLSVLCMFYSLPCTSWWSMFPVEHWVFCVCSTACPVHRNGVYSRCNTECFVYVLQLALYIVMEYIPGGTLGVLCMFYSLPCTSWWSMFPVGAWQRSWTPHSQQWLRPSTALRSH